ncbi:MAG: hypothetical protein PHU85_02690 [Phycisphaerae bacterium]|nr:hypothetical protein [Phycisphaerae bacterium]
MPNVRQSSLDIRILKSAGVQEVFLTAVGDCSSSVADQARQVYAEAADFLRSTGARVVQERLFVSADAAAASAARAAEWKTLDDGVAPTLLLDGMPGRVSGLQVHAVVGTEPRIVGGAVRTVELDGRKHIFMNGLARQGAGDPAAQAKAMFEQAEQLLRLAGADMRDVARTWLWLGDVLDWYDDLNRVRSEFFRRCGLIGEARALLPASTGIGVRPAGGPICAMDLRAIRWARESPANGGPLFECFEAAGRQKSAFSYGSAFSRAAACDSPAGKTLFVSGTAAIDTTGVSRHIGDPAGQIAMTLDNVRAILQQHDCDRDGDVVQAMAYCKTADVERVWRTGWNLPWPTVTVVADVCRAELLFEVEVMACRNATRV